MTTFETETRHYCRCRTMNGLSQEKCSITTSTRLTAETAKGKAPLASGASDGSRWRKRRAAPVPIH
jgi:hypothetical protein